MCATCTNPLIYPLPRTTLSVPSVVFAEASWYGSLRVGVESQDSKIGVVDFGSRWGIKGSTEAGEGLTALYRFEHKINAANASLSGGGRLSYVGLSGGFGTLTMGQIWSASYNSFGAITDNSFAYGDSQTTYRHGSAISYAFSNDLMALQFDAVYDDPQSKFKDDKGDPNEDLERTEFGVSVNIGELGKVALAYVDDKYAVMDLQAAGVEGNGAVSEGDTTWRTKTTSVAGEISVAGMTAYIGTQNAKNICTGVVPAADAAGTACDQSATGQVNSKAKTTFFGVRGGLGDTGINYVFQYRNKKDNDRKPWILGLSKSLGGGASLHFEHDHTDDPTDPKESSLTLKVDF